MVGTVNAELIGVNEMIVTPSTYQLEPGEVFNIRINIVPDEPISGTQFDLSLSGGDHSVNSIDEGDFFTKHGIVTFFGKYLNSDPTTPATLYCAALGRYQTSEPGTIATFNLTAGNSTGHLIIDLSDVVLSNSISQPLVYSISNATLLIDSGPVLSSPGTFYIEAENTLKFTLEAFDPDNDQLVFTCTSLPDGASLDPITGIFTWTPSIDQAGEYRLDFEAKDGYLSDSGLANITVMSTNIVPVANINGPYETVVGRKIRFDSSGSYDPDGNIVSYEWNFGDGYMSTDAKPFHAYTVSGEYSVMLTVEDNMGIMSKDSTTAIVQDTVWSKLKNRK
ncbi:PKD domain-containing protein [Methanolobus sp. ZRKC3]|uniref:PKD domain-containing protein n=1 Tax=Methanolobus sp. ZRKC3 TaxID=3125786 RepID=UPI003254A815